MDADAANVRRLLRQQAAIAGFGSFALRTSDLMEVLTEAARICAEGLAAPFSKICRYRAPENDMLIVAGFGWGAGLIDCRVSAADETSPQGRAFITGKPAICNDLRHNDDFVLPSFYAEYSIISTIDIVIKGDEHPWGVLEIDNDQQHDYDEHDINFLTGFANVLAEAVAISERTALVRSTIEAMQALVEEKDRLLEQKQVLAQELQHRVRNNLQLIYGMLGRQLQDTEDDGGRQGIKAIARRVSTLAQVYDHLLGNEMSRTTDFGNYVKSLCASLSAIQPGMISLTCDSDPLLLDLDIVTALGLVVAELVTNTYDHAFPDGHGATHVSLRLDDDRGDMATLIVRDNGRGFERGPGNKRHGLGLIMRLIEQVRGTANVVSDRGTIWTIRFPAPTAA